MIDPVSPLLLFAIGLYIHTSTYLVLVAGALHHLRQAGEAVAHDAEQIGQVRKLAGAVVPGDEAAARLLGC